MNITSASINRSIQSYPLISSHTSVWETTKLTLTPEKQQKHPHWKNGLNMFFFVQEAHGAIKRKTSWWFQPLSKICSSNWIISPFPRRFGVKIKTIWNPWTSMHGMYFPTWTAKNGPHSIHGKWLGKYSHFMGSPMGKPPPSGQLVMCETSSQPIWNWPRWP